MGYMEDLRKEVGTRPLILVGATVLVIQDDTILLQKRKEPYGVWGLPGGLMEMGESTKQAAYRELLEETGLHASTLTLLDVFSGSYFYTKLKNGDEFYSVTTAYLCTQWSGDMKNEEAEALGLQFFSLSQLPEKMVGSHRKMIETFIQRNSTQSNE